MARRRPRRSWRLQRALDYTLGKDVWGKARDQISPDALKKSWDSIAEACTRQYAEATGEDGEHERR